MAGGERIQLRLQLGDVSEDELVVLRFEGREGLCEPYAFEVEFLTASGEPLDLEALVGQPALLTLERPTGEVRHVHGEVFRVRMTGIAAALPRYSVRIGPRLARLASTTSSRIFQELGVPKVLLQVLDGHGVATRDALGGSYPDVEFLVQYRERDLDFVSRLLEAEGAWYRFEHSAGAHELVLGDAPSAYLEAASLPFRPVAEQAEGVEHVSAIARVRRVTSDKVAWRDYDFARPGLDLTARAGSGEREVYEYPGGYVAPGEGKRLAGLRLEDLRYGEETFEGRGNALCLQPGSTIEVTEHRDETLNGKRLVVRVSLSGSQQLEPGGITPIAGRFECRFEAIDGSRPYRPRRRTPRPRVAGIQTATVVGPSGEEVWTDAHGRIKIQFHWDRDGKQDAHSSCFVRVAQGWAGGAMGAAFLPRLGQEVVVRFLEGDPDRPLVAGAVYNGTHPPPVQLPDEKTQSTQKTASSPGSGGFNELRFEDAQGAEVVALHAQKDKQIAVGNDKAQTVRLDEALEVKGNRTQRIQGNQKLRVDGDDVRAVKAAQTVSVSKDRKKNVGASESVQVVAAQAVTVAMARKLSATGGITRTVGGARALTIGGGLMANVGAALTHTVAGTKSTQVKGSAGENVGGIREESIEQNRVQRTQGDFDIKLEAGAQFDVEGDSKQEVGGGEEVLITGNSLLVVKAGTLETDKLTIAVNGKEALSLAKSGKLKLSGQAITFDGGGEITVKAQKVKKITSGALDSKKAEVEKLKDGDEPKKVVRVTFSGADGKPALANLQFKLKLPDGSTKEGAVSASGEIAVADVSPGKCELELTGLEEPPKQGK